MHGTITMGLRSDRTDGAAFSPLIVGIGGTSRPASGTERIVGLTLDAAAREGARIQMFGGEFLMRLPLYAPDQRQRTPEERALIQAVRQADGLVIATPGYHGGMSGVVKNALDLIEDTAADERAYLDGVAVGLIVVAAGWQAAGTTLTSMRSTVHALRGWPTPFGAAINSSGGLFTNEGRLVDPSIQSALDTLANQVVDFARWRNTYAQARRSS